MSTLSTRRKTSQGVVIEIRAAEGGADAKDLVHEQFSVYAAYCKLRGHTCKVTEERPGMTVLEVRGNGAAQDFAGEPGGHRWQRVPPTERRGRRQTSTVTVAVFPLLDESEWSLDPDDIEEAAIRGSGPGGQHHQKNATVIRAKHLPTGITAIVSGRSQWANRRAARAELEARVAAARDREHQSAKAANRRRQVGSGERGDKIRTVRLQDGRVVDHRTGKRMSVELYRKGYVHDLV